MLTNIKCIYISYKPAFGRLIVTSRLQKGERQVSVIAANFDLEEDLLNNLDDEKENITFVQLLDIPKHKFILEQVTTKCYAEPVNSADIWINKYRAFLK